MKLSTSRQRLGVIVASAALVGGMGGGLAAAQPGGGTDSASLTAAGERAGTAAVSAKPHSATGADAEASAAKKCPRGKEFVKFKHGWTAGYSKTMTALVGKGSQGKHVTEAQCLLAGWGYKPGAVDGVYGPSTASAVKAYQGKNGLPKDGIVGKKTWKKLRVTSGK